MTTLKNYLLVHDESQVSKVTYFKSQFTTLCVINFDIGFWMASSQRTSLSDKLKSLGVGKGASHLPQPKPDSLSIDSVVAGAFHPTPPRAARCFITMPWAC